jgi:uncharacterized protein YjbJ (UPF0337 family)
VQQNELTKGASAVGAKSDQTKGRIKEAAGDVTGNERLKREGKVDQAGAKVKGKVSKGIDKMKRAVGEKK